MIELYAEHLTSQVQETLFPCYMLFGNDLVLLQNSQNFIRKILKKHQFNDYFSITLDTNTKWDMIFNFCQTNSLFSNRRILLITITDNSIINASISRNMLKLSSLLHHDMVLILRSNNNLTRTIENMSWFKKLSKNSVLVNCNAPEQKQLLQLVIKYATKMNLVLTDDAYQLLCSCYNGNLIALTQVLERLSLIYYKDDILTSSDIKKVLYDINFTLYQWIEAVLAGKIKTVTSILYTLRLMAVEPVIILRSIQREVLLLLKLKRHNNTSSLNILFDIYNIQLNRRILLTKAIKRLSLAQLHHSVMLMTKTELMLKQNYYSNSVWFSLNILALLLCTQSIPIQLFDV